MGMSFYRHCIRPNLHLSSSVAPRRKLGRQRRVLMLIPHLRLMWTCLMPLTVRLRQFQLLRLNNMSGQT